MKQEIVWTDPPRQSASQDNGVWVEQLTPVMERPNMWALIRTGDIVSMRNAKSALSTGRVIRPAGRWEFVTRTLDREKGEAGLWARYLGPDGKGAG